MALACMHAWEAPRSDSVSLIGWLHPKQRAESGPTLWDLMEPGHILFSGPDLRGAFSWGQPSEDVSYILRSGVGTHQLCRPLLFMPTFEISFAINVQLLLPSFHRCSLGLKPETLACVHVGM